VFATYIAWHLTFGTLIEQRPLPCWVWMAGAEPGDLRQRIRRLQVERQLCSSEKHVYVLTALYTCIGSCTQNLQQVQEDTMDSPYIYGRWPSPNWSSMAPWCTSTPGLYKENMCKSGQMASERHFRLDNIICIHSRHFCELYCVYLHLVELQLCMRSKRYTLPQLYGNFCSEQLIRAWWGSKLPRTFAI